MIRRRTGLAVAAVVLVASIPGMAIMAIPPTLVGPPQMMMFIGSTCRTSITEPGGTGPGAPIPFRALQLGAPVVRTTTSFPTGGSGTANLALAAERKAKGLPYEPPMVDTRSAKPAATFAAASDTPAARAVYQRLPLTPSNRVARPNGMIFARTTSATRGKIVSLALYFANRPAALPRLRITTTGSAAQGCPPQSIDIYAPRTTATTLHRLFAMSPNGCNWVTPDKCTRAQWPRGRVLFVSPTYGNAFEYRWIDYDMLTRWHFGSAPSR